MTGGLQCASANIQAYPRQAPRKRSKERAQHLPHPQMTTKANGTTYGGGGGSSGSTGDSSAPQQSDIWLAWWGGASEDLVWGGAVVETTGEEPHFRRGKPHRVRHKAPTDTARSDPGPGFPGRAQHGSDRALHRWSTGIGAIRYGQRTARPRPHIRYSCRRQAVLHAVLSCHPVCRALTGRTFYKELTGNLTRAPER